MIVQTRYPMLYPMWSVDNVENIEQSHYNNAEGTYIANTLLVVVVALPPVV